MIEMKDEKDSGLLVANHQKLGIKFEKGNFKSSNSIVKSQ